jgi:hypothetical protein
MSLDPLETEGRNTPLVQRTSLKRETDTAYEVFKTRVRAERIKARPQQDTWVEALFISFF